MDSIYAIENDLDHDSLYDASPQSSTKKLYTNSEQLMVNGGVDEAREKRDHHKASTVLGKMNGCLDDASEIGVNVNTTPHQGRKTGRLMQIRHRETIVAAESALSPATKPTAAKKSRSHATMNRVRAVASANPDISNENDDLFNVPESPDQLKKTKSANEKASKGRKATKSRAKPAVYSAKVAGRSLVASTAKPQHKEVIRPSGPTKPPKTDDTDWNEGFEVDEDQVESATVRKKAQPTSSKRASAVKGKKKKNIEVHNSPVLVGARSLKKKKTSNSKIAAKRQSSPVAPVAIKTESSKKAKTPSAKNQSSPIALNQPKVRRAAAVKANNRIQGIQDEDVDLSVEPLQPESVMDLASNDSYADHEADPDQGKLRGNEDYDLIKTSPFTERPFQKPFHNEIHIKNGKVGYVNDAVPSARAVGSPKVLLSEACGSPDEVALLRHLNENMPRPTIGSGHFDKQVASADANSSEKENRKAATQVEDMEQPLDHYFDDALAYSDDDINHKLRSVEKETLGQEAELVDDALNEEPLADQRRRMRGSKFQNSSDGVSTKTRRSVASKLREALSGVLNISLDIEDLSGSKDSLPRASAKFQPKMTEPTPDEELKRTKPSRGTISKKPLNAGNEDKEEKIVGRFGESNEKNPQYVALKNLTQSKTLEPAETAQGLDAPQAALDIVKSNADHIKFEGANIIINISSEDGEVSEYFSDEAGEDDVPFAVGDQWEFFPPTPVAPVVVAAKPKHATAKKQTATSEAVAISKTAEAHAGSRTGKRKSRDHDDGARITKKLKAQLPIMITTPLKQAGTKIRREGTPTPLIEEYLHRKSTLISFSAKGPRNQGIVSVQKPRVSVMASNNPERQKNHQKEALMKRKRDEDTVAGARLVETPEEKRRRHSRARSSTGTSALHMVETSQRLSSQGTRVDANGSPRPLARDPRRSDEWADGILKRFQGLENSPIAPIENAMDHTEIDHFTVKGDDLPTLSSGSLPDQDEGKMFPSIRKQLPSSPNAPSQILADLTAHRVQPGGRFVNVETESIVKPSVPQDPFTGNVRRRPSTFMERLRAQGKLAEKSRNDPDGKDPTQADPDKTLVVAESADSSSPGLRPDTSSESSDSPNLSSHGQSNGRGSEDEAARQWREALQPHQTSQLEILYDISNVSGYPDHHLDLI